jgi:FkbM family methyltransferase
VPETFPEALATAPATLEDVVNCYRLVLGRAPDAQGLEHYRERLARGGVGLGQLRDEFLGSVEFARAQTARQRAAPVVEVVPTVEGFRAHLDPADHAIGYALARSGSYEPGVTATVRALLKPGATFVDVGANIGWFSLLAASLVGPEGRVVAIEPNPGNVSLLELSAADNGYANIEAFTVALGEGPGAVALETDGSNGRVIPITGPPGQPVRASYVVGAEALDDVLARAGVHRVDVMKMDVEGAEPLVLRGARRVLAESRPVLITEFHPVALDSSPWGSARGYLAQLRGHGYRLSIISPDAGPPGSTESADDGAILAAAALPGLDHVDLLAQPS